VRPGHGGGVDHGHRGILGSTQCAAMQTLHTSRLVLEPLLAAHADALYPMLCDPRQLEFLDHGAPASLDALRERQRKLESRRSADGREHWLNWAIVLRDEGDAIGFVQATVQEDHRAWVAYQVATARWGQGLASEATRAMVDHLASHYAVTQCLATVDRRNERSWRLLERLGFARAEAAQAVEMEVQAGDWLYLR
jgi:[ribosomal protein S5]-alanine N-acetyltransferase